MSKDHGRHAVFHNFYTMWMVIFMLSCKVKTVTDMQSWFKTKVCDRFVICLFESKDCDRLPVCLV